MLSQLSKGSFRFYIPFVELVFVLNVCGNIPLAFMSVMKYDKLINCFKNVLIQHITA